MASPRGSDSTYALPARTTDPLLVVSDSVDRPHDTPLLRPNRRGLVRGGLAVLGAHLIVSRACAVHLDIVTAAFPVRWEAGFYDGDLDWAWGLLSQAEGQSQACSAGRDGRTVDPTSIVESDSPRANSSPWSSFAPML